MTYEMSKRGVIREDTTGMIRGIREEELEEYLIGMSTGYRECCEVLLVPLTFVKPNGVYVQTKKCIFCRKEHGVVSFKKGNKYDGVTGML